MSASSYAALCTDFYVNQKVALRMDIPERRETVLDMFDRIRRTLPFMEQFRRYEDELALESPEFDARYCWLALRRTSIRSGWVNPDSLDEAYKLHRLILEVAPYYLTISPLDVEYIELVFGFDLGSTVNCNEIIFDALYSDSPLAGLIDNHGETLLDVQPRIGLCLNDRCSRKAYIEIKSSPRSLFSPKSPVTGMETPAIGAFEPLPEPISVYLTVRQDGPLDTTEDFNSVFGALAGYTERLAEERVIPQVIMPLRDTLLSHPG